MNKIVFICLGNICRSPLAEGIVRARAAAAGRDLVLDSAGTGDWHVGQPPDRRAIAVAAAHGIDISGLRARRVVAEDFLRFDLLLCADRANLAQVQRLRPAGARAEAALLLDWTGLAREGEVPDPYGGDLAEFESVYRLLDNAAQALLQRLAARQRTSE